MAPLPVGQGSKEPARGGVLAGWSLGQRNGRPATWVDLAGIVAQNLRTEGRLSTSPVALPVSFSKLDIPWIDHIQ